MTGAGDGEAAHVVAAAAGARRRPLCRAIAMLSNVSFDAFSDNALLLVEADSRMSARKRGTSPLEHYEDKHQNTWRDG